MEINKINCNKMSNQGENTDQSKGNSVQEFSTDLLRVYYGKFYDIL